MDVAGTILDDFGSGVKSLMLLLDQSATLTRGEVVYDVFASGISSSNIRLARCVDRGISDDGRRDISDEHAHSDGNTKSMIK